MFCVAGEHYCVVLTLVAGGHEHFARLRVLGKLLLLLRVIDRMIGGQVDGFHDLDIAERFGERLDLTGDRLFVGILADRIAYVEKGIVVRGRRECRAAVEVVPGRDGQNSCFEEDYWKVQ